MKKVKNKSKVKKIKQVKQFNLVNKKEPLGVRILAIIIFVNAFFILGLSLFSLFNAIGSIKPLFLIIDLVLTLVISGGLFFIGFGLGKRNIIARNLAVVVLVFSFISKLYSTVQLESISGMMVLQLVGVLLLNGGLIAYLFLDENAKNFFKK